MSTQKYSRQDVIDALQFVAEKLDKSPSQAEYRRNKRCHHPSVSWIVDKFKSWNYAKEIAGLSVTPYSCDHSNEDAIEALQRVSERIGKSPTVSEYIRHKKDCYPSPGWINDNLGSWNKTKKRAGLDILNTEGAVEYSREGAIDALQSVAEEIGKSPTESEYIRHKKDCYPSPAWIHDNLGSWNDAKVTAGLKKYSDGIYKSKKSFMEKIKAHRQCKECGLEEPDRKLHFHHIEPDTKVDTVGAMIQTDYSIEELKTEIKKCEILCDTCHGRKHSKTVTEEDCINAVQSIADQLDHSPTYTEYEKHKKDHHPHRSTIYKKFNSWSDVKEAVNLESTQTTLQSDFASPSRNDE